MKPDAKILILFAFPVLAALACAAMTFVLPEAKPYVPNRPVFLNYLDQLGVSSESSKQISFSESIRNVFSYEDQSEEPVEEIPIEDTDYVVEAPAANTPVTISMLVESGSKSFSVINGKKMRVGDSTASFALTAIRNNSVTIRHSDGTLETIHVKAY